MAFIHSSPCMELYDLFQLLYPGPSKELDDPLITSLNQRITSGKLCGLQLRQLLSAFMEQMQSGNIRNPSGYMTKLLGGLAATQDASSNIMAAAGMDQLLGPGKHLYFTTVFLVCSCMHSRVVSMCLRGLSRRDVLFQVEALTVSCMLGLGLG
jgi:hypothetical protein